MAEPIVTIEGNMTRDPVVKFLDSGTKQISFGVAINHRWKAQGASEYSERRSFYDVVLYEDRTPLVGNIESSLRKGMMVIVSGTQCVREFDRSDGSKGVAVEIRAISVGPSLRFASAVVTASPRAGGSSNGGSRPAPEATTYGFDEEPF